MNRAEKIFRKNIMITKVVKLLKRLFNTFFISGDLLRYKNQNKLNNRNFPEIRLKDIKPILSENTPNTDFDTHYTYHPAWAARLLQKIQPEKHVDISSALYFSAIISAFIPVEFYDFRPANLQLSNLKTGMEDLTALSFEDGSIQSLSCMHTVEHIGLGRYGDPIDPDGDLKAIDELKRVLAPGGSLIFAIPVGKPRIQFNAHRIYSYEQIIAYFDGLKLEEFSLIPDNAGEVGMISNAAPELVKEQVYGCGCFWFTKD